MSPAAGALAWLLEGAPDWRSTLFAAIHLRLAGAAPRDARVDAAMTRLAQGFR